MNSIVKQVCWCVGMVCVLAPAVYAGEKETQENPTYKHWAQFKPGTYVILEQINEALSGNTKNVRAWNLKTAILRRLGHDEEASRVAMQVCRNDPLDRWSQQELRFLQVAQAVTESSPRLSASRAGPSQACVPFPVPGARRADGSPQHYPTI